ncbi:LOW QUALITY PROTEIN: QWRF motif-containing protein 2-like [Chenopodium quinoa]|uniref:LOW QUALITY PROTEIN: QWRF motif-containing protein 2-like n=1 Tax=Chenopodium quinoa TaxID=63459 RepID=UPI000B788C5D|nr:LOW QUALITY PROTEIN: QWRF motif-containing protein 2-like [Chenopodium quinoa]
MIMVAAISEFGTPRNPANSRPPLLQQERENGVHQQQQQQQQQPRRLRPREVPSRYMSISSSSANSSTTTSTTTTNSTSSTSTSSSISRRFPSPVIARNNRTPVTPKRSQSVDRRRSGTVKPTPVANASEISAATKLLVTSTRSLSVSFQGESFSLPISKTKAVNQGNGNSNSARKATPERRRGTPVKGKVDGGGDQVDNSNSNSKPGDQHRWPARNRELNMLSRSLDCSNNESKEYLGSSVVARALKDSFLDESRRASFDGILNLDSSNGDVLNGIRGAMDENSVNDSSVPSDLTASDTDSVSSGSTSGAQDVNNGSHGRSVPRGIVVSARFWQETNMRLRRLQDPGLGLSPSPTSKFSAPPKLSQSKKFSDGPMSSPRAMSSPIRGAVRAASPSKLMNTPVSSPMRGVSPSRVRSSIGSSVGCSPWDTPSVLSFAVDVRRGKVGENRIVDAHQLRLLYNRQLQWRFVNARADDALSVQRQNAEKNLWNAWIAITALRDSVRHKRTQVQLLRQKLKLSSILRGQMAYLEEWSLLDKDHTNSLLGAIEALKASTLRLPVVGGATVDIRSVKEAVGSAVDVMQSMASSTCSLLTKVEEVNSLVAELSNIATKERVLLEKKQGVLSMLAAMQVKDCSLRTHTLQLNRSQLA